ncbi:hypothetical protein B0J12DRAFT_705666 [Macrophomina phaseolina]|uniref:Uncharacterized protein n=1 Tax=Macrophomina phaseolina TaxID=35725 RepID=A0ABQ8FRH8_9PEZI|nr:hypothetical protein B0J12DRAFT_705666 [Macrophomina phaseolina]
MSVHTSGPNAQKLTVGTAKDRSFVSLQRTRERIQRPRPINLQPVIRQQPKNQGREAGLHIAGKALECASRCIRPPMPASRQESASEPPCRLTATPAQSSLANPVGAAEPMLDIPPDVEALYEYFLHAGRCHKDYHIGYYTNDAGAGSPIAVYLRSIGEECPSFTFVAIENRPEGRHEYLVPDGLIKFDKQLGGYCGADVRRRLDEFWRHYGQCLMRGLPFALSVVDLGDSDSDISWEIV